MKTFTPRPPVTVTVWGRGEDIYDLEGFLVAETADMIRVSMSPAPEEDEIVRTLPKLQTTVRRES